MLSPSDCHDGRLYPTVQNDHTRATKSAKSGAKGFYVTAHTTAVHRQYASDTLIICTEQSLRDVTGNLLRAHFTSQSNPQSNSQSIIHLQLNLLLHSNRLLISRNKMFALHCPVMSCHALSYLIPDALSVPPPACSRTSSRCMETPHR